jgi:predicted NBD/HSP70 family sugar kinase
LSDLPRITAPLDPGFAPAVVAARRYREAVARSTVRKERLVLGLERESGFVSRYETEILPDAGGSRGSTLRFVDRTVKFLLWARGGWRLHVEGPSFVTEYLRACCRPEGDRRFDVELMGRVYERPFEVVMASRGAVPEERGSRFSLGGHLDGCRIGFDLGASDYKVAAVIDGEAAWSGEFPWDPKDEPDPRYHYDHLLHGLNRAAEHLPRVDAIGGSSAGVFVDSRPMVASLFRSVHPDRFEHEVKKMFRRLAAHWADVPIVVVNDGDVTALAGTMALGEGRLLGIAMGSSEAAGYMDASCRITGWLNELAFAPVEDREDAPIDEWSGDRGVGVQYFSQQAVNRLLPAAGIEVREDAGLPERLREVQDLVAAGDDRARRIFETIGVYLGYAIPWYAEFYDLRHVLVLGRVTSGEGGAVLVARAREVLAAEFPEIAEGVALHLPDEKTKRVGQAVAAASLPELRSRGGKR